MERSSALSVPSAILSVPRMMPLRTDPLLVKMPDVPSGNMSPHIACIDLRYGLGLLLNDSATARNPGYSSGPPYGNMYAINPAVLSSRVYRRTQQSATHSISSLPSPVTAFDGAPTTPWNSFLQWS